MTKTLYVFCIACLVFCFSCGGDDEPKPPKPDEEEPAKTYQELLAEEKAAVNAYLKGVEVKSVPENNDFICGENAPFYKLDKNGNVYMRVIDRGKGEKQVEQGATIYFRFTRFNLMSWYLTGAVVPEGNANDITQLTASFIFQDFSFESSKQWGEGIQMPLIYLYPYCEVMLIVKSQKGPAPEVSAVQPYLYHIRYYPATTDMQ